MAVVFRAWLDNWYPWYCRYPRGKQSRDLQLLYSWIEGLRTDLHAGGGMPLDGLLTEGLLAYYPNGGSPGGSPVWKHF